MRSTVDAKTFRAVLGHFPTGVVVITARCPDGMPAGMAIGSFTSASLDPPLVAFLPAKSSSSWPRIREAGSFCANVLGHGQSGLVERSAISGGDKFAGLDWTPAPSGHPILPGAPAWIDCELMRVDDAGDHWIVLARVRSLSADSSHPGSLVFAGAHSGSSWRLGRMALKAWSRIRMAADLGGGKPACTNRGPTSWPASSRHRLLLPHLRLVARTSCR